MAKTGGSRKKTTKSKRKTWTQKRLKQVHKHLEEKRDEILAMYQHDLRVSKETSDEGTDDIVDRANNAYNRELLFALSSGERQLLEEVEEAIGRIEAGEFGDCLSCSNDIAEQRLQAVPWARYCIDCQELSEKGMLEHA